MKTFFMDTNLFIRYLVNDDPEKADWVEKLLKQATSGKIRLVTADLVIAEVIWVLESAYGLKNAEITPMVKGILATPGIEVTNAELVGRALDYYESLNIDFIDGYIAAVMDKMKVTEIYSFDIKHISRVKELKRIEP
ncbi:MAG: type II toxin-antitoxin system VapC family toxin [Deltaproteobacteria bacterium]|nr:type II toxin-antitoxin system VapC family toxin [Deltaproteobacteria bacterium]